MESSPTPRIKSQSALQHRQEEMQQQTKFFKLAVPIALVFHGLTIGGLFMLSQRAVPEVAAEEVEIIADNTPPEPKETPQPIDPNGPGSDFAGGGGGGGSSKFSLFQTEGGTKDSNNIAALGNPFRQPDVIPESAPLVNSEPAETVPQDAIDPEEKPKEISKPDSKDKPPSIEKSKPSLSQSTEPPKPGELDGTKNGTGSKGDPNGGKLNPNAASGVGKAGGAGAGKGPGNGTGIGTGNGSGDGSGQGPRNGNGTGKSGSQPVAPVPQSVSQPASQPVSQPKPVAIVTQPEPAKKGPKCVENCGLDEYLGAEGSLRISQEIDKNGNVTPKLLQSSGNSELDRKALEAIQRRKYETSDDGYSNNIRVTSQQEGSDFARQQEDRRRQEQSDRNAINRDRILQDQERQTREVEKPTVPIESSIPEPIIKPAPESIPNPIAAPIPEPIAPPIVQPVAPAPEPIAAPAPESIAPPIAEPVAPVPESIPEPVAPIPIPEAVPIVPVPEPAPTSPQLISP